MTRNHATSAANTAEKIMELEGITITHPDREVFPEAGLSKGDVAEYYAGVAEHILPHLADRPLSVVRCPRGRSGSCFYQKHRSEGMPDAVRPIPVREKHGRSDYLGVTTAAGLVALVQFGVIEFHPWLARADRLDRPDLMVFDLDPGDGVEWPEVVAAGRSLRDNLADLGLASFVKLTGGKGLHLVVPLDRRAEFETVKTVARAVVGRLRDRDPDRFLVTAAKEDREGRIFLDYLRNARGATAVAPFSARARPGAPVAVPVAWDELAPGLQPDHHSIATLPRRLGALRRDPWSGFGDTRQSITQAVLAELPRDG